MAYLENMSTNLASSQTKPYKVRITSGGRIVIPAEIRQALGVKEGEEVLLTKDEGGFRLTSYQEAIGRAQALFARLKSDNGKSLVDELLKERRAEVEQEEREFSERYGSK
jgi:AbrB family looped-hinge helix DNA binding protein